ncbi:MAG: hypothetical protein WAO83_18435 [Fuerstiella sp.]
MASPFKFFRKYSSGMMIILVILSMLLFTLTDLFSDPGKNLWLLGLLLGGTVFGVAGVGQGRWLQWGLGGAAFGALLGFILPGFTENSGLSTSLGVISMEEMDDLEMRRGIANQVIGGAFDASYGQGMARFAPYFGFGHRSNREDVIFGRLLRAEADRLGITVDASMVSAYLKQATSDGLKKSAYVDIRNRLSFKGKPVNDAELSEIMADEIKAQMAYQMLRPRTTSLPPGPEVYWQYFKRLNVRQQLEVVALDVNDFIDQVGEPSETDVNELFAKYKTKMPNEVEPGSPGFRLNFRAQLAYLELDSDSVKSQVGEVTDADIETYYNDNKESSLIKRTVFPDMELPDAAKEDAPTDEAAKTEETKSEEGSETPAKPDAEAAAPQEEAKPEPATEAPAAAEPAKPAAEEKATEAQPEPEAAAPEAAAPEENSCDPFAPDEQAATEEKQATEPAAPVTEETPVAAQAKTPEAAATTPAAEETPPTAPSASTLTIPPAEGITITPETSATPAPEIKFEYRELNDELKSEIREEILRQRVKEAIDKKMAAAVSQMTALARERSAHRFALIEENPAKFDGNSDGQQEAFKELRASMKSYDAEISDKLKAYADENGLAYVQTPLLSPTELMEEDDYPIATATEPSDNPMFAQQSATVAMNTFQGFNNEEQNNDAQLFLVREAQRSTMNLEGGQSRYAYWSIDFSPGHVPTLDEPGVKDSVVLTWKQMKAQELVKKRGEELAKLVRDGLAKEGDARVDMAEALKDQTATGKEDGPAIAVRGTMPFSWLRTSSAAPNSGQRPQASMSAIQFSDSTGGTLALVGEKFMSTIFDEMSDEEVSVVPNFDMSKHYVVHVTNRYPTPEVGMDVLQERFATEGKQFAFSQSPMLPVIQQEVGGPASLQWEKSVWLRYDIDPDQEPEEN